jgi:hypothetical protein
MPAGIGYPPRAPTTETGGMAPNAPAPRFRGGPGSAALQQKQMAGGFEGPKGPAPVRALPTGAGPKGPPPAAGVNFARPAPMVGGAFGMRSAPAAGLTKAPISAGQASPFAGPQAFRQQFSRGNR